jgi:hypothetical protein
LLVSTVAAKAAKAATSELSAVNETMFLTVEFIGLESCPASVLLQVPWQVTPHARDWFDIRTPRR